MEDCWSALRLRRLPPPGAGTMVGTAADGARVASSASPASSSPPKLCDWGGAGAGGGVDGAGGCDARGGPGGASDVAACACCCCAWICAWGVGPAPKRSSISRARSMRGPLTRVSVTFNRRFWSASGERYSTRLLRLAAIVRVRSTPQQQSALSF